MHVHSYFGVNFLLLLEWDRKTLSLVVTENGLISNESIYAKFTLHTNSPSSNIKSIMYHTKQFVCKRKSPIFQCNSKFNIFHFVHTRLFCYVGTHSILIHVSHYMVQRLQTVKECIISGMVIS